MFRVYGAINNFLWLKVSIIVKTSKYKKYLYLKELSIEYVKQIFEERIADAIEDSDLGWDKKDINLVHEYFRVNYLDKK